MKLLITGAAGFIGGTIAALAAQRGHEVAGLVTPTTWDQRPDPQPASWRPLRGTLADPPWDELEAFAPQACVHAAWDTRLGLDSSGHDVFVGWSRDFLRGLLGRGLQRATILGTCIEYRRSAVPFREDTTPIEPSTRYGAAKAALHSLLRDDFWAAGRPLTWGRVFYVYGRGEAATKFCSAALAAFQANQPFVVGTPDSLKDYLHVTDAAAALLQATESAYDGALNVCTGNGIRLGELARLLQAAHGSTGLVVDANPPHADAAGDAVGECAPLRQLGWKPRISLEAGISDMIAALVPQV